MKKAYFALVCVLLVVPCAAKTIIVDGSGGGDYTKIQDAINHSLDGDIIIVKPGTYNQSIHFYGRAITLTSDPNEPSAVQSTIITASVGYSVNFDWAEGPGSILTSFTITGGGIYGASSSTPTISGNIIRSNSGRGIDGCNGLITNNIVSENNGGIAYCDGLISNNIIRNNSASYGGGLYFCDGDIVDNVIANNSAVLNGGAFYRCDGNISGNIIIANKAGNDGGGLYNCGGSSDNINNNIIAGNESQRWGGGLYNCVANIINNTIVGNRASRGGAIDTCGWYIRNNIIAFNQADNIGGIYGSSFHSYNVFWENEGGHLGEPPGPGDVVFDPYFAAEGYWDDNGNLKMKDMATDITLVYNWDNKLRHGQYSSSSIDLKYDPMGNRIWKKSGVSMERKYIVDIVGDLPTILMELDPQDNMTIKKTYIYANGQVLMQHSGAPATNNKYFYMHDRLGSVRQVIDSSGVVKAYLTYKPFGETLETGGSAPFLALAPFRFTGQYYDTQISEYYMRARQYDPHIGRFTSRDPVRGRFEEPLTLHRYLYCMNDPTNRMDPTGEMSLTELTESTSIGARLLRSAISGVLGALGGGLKNYAIDRPVWKGALSGGIGAAVPAFFSFYGYVGAAVSGGITSGMSSALDENTVNRVIVDTLGGIAMSSVLFGVTDYCVTNFIDTNLVGFNADDVEYLYKLFQPVGGSAGGNIWSIISNLMFYSED